MKRTLSILLALEMLLSLAACDSDGAASTQSAQAPSDAASVQSPREPSQPIMDSSAEGSQAEAATSPETNWDPEIFNLEDDTDKYLGRYAVPGDVPSFNLPLTEEDITLTYFYSNQFVQESGFETLAENEMWQELMKITGINLEFHHQAPDTIQEKFGLLLAGNDLTDLIQDFQTYTASRSLDTAIEEEYYVDLAAHTDMVPHLMGILESDETLLKNATTDSGYIPMFPEISFYEWRMPETTFAVRTDILESTGYSGTASPETFDELHDMLVWFRDEAGMPNALGVSSLTQGIIDPWLLMGLGISGDYYLDDGQVQYSLISDEFRTMLEYLSQWQKEKLVDPDFYASVANNPVDKLCITNKLGVGMIFTPFCAQEFQFSANPDLYLTAMKSPVVDAAKASYFPMFEEGKYSLTLGRGTAVSASSDYIDEALRLMDFFYSDQGALMANYGIRQADGPDGDGLYYYDETGTPQTTEFIRNYDGYDTVEFRIQYPPFFIQMYLLDAYSDELMSAVEPVLEQQQAETCYERRLPDSYSMTADEGYTFAGIMGDVKTYMEESVIQFIVGDKELTDASWTEYVETVKSMNIDEAMGCIQSAVDRYEDR